MGLENQLSDVSTESIIILTVVLIGKTVCYLRSLLTTILRAIGVFSNPHSDFVGSGMARLILLRDQLNLHRVSSEDGADHSGLDCVVCRERFAGGDTVRKLPCRHVFHKDCFDGWLAYLNFNCPLCRAPLLSDEIVRRTRRRVAGGVLGWFPFQ